MTLFEIVELPKKRGKIVYQITTNTRIFFVSLDKKTKIDESIFERYLGKSETIQSIKTAIDVIIPT